MPAETANIRSRMPGLRFHGSLRMPVAACRNAPGQWLHLGFQDFTYYKRIPFDRESQQPAAGPQRGTNADLGKDMVTLLGRTYIEHLYPGILWHAILAFEIWSWLHCDPLSLAGQRLQLYLLASLQVGKLLSSIKLPMEASQTDDSDDTEG